MAEVLALATMLLAAAPGSEAGWVPFAFPVFWNIERR
jgi:hypothetical protein